MLEMLYDKMYAYFELKLDTLFLEWNHIFFSYKKHTIEVYA